MLHIISIGSRMSASEFMPWMRVMFWTFQNYLEVIYCENFKISQAIIKQEMHKKVHVIFLFIIFSTIIFWHKIFTTFYLALCAHTLQFSGWLSKYFDFRIFFWLLNIDLVWNRKTKSCQPFCFCFQIWCLWVFL